VWEKLVFNIYANGIKNVTVLSMFPDYYQPVNPAAITYVDDITVVFDPTIVPPPVPTTLTLFDNSADNRFYDPSYIAQTAPSTVVAENWQGPNMTGGDKYPVVTTPVKAGANALKLDWKSVTAGDWAAMVAGLGFKVFDLTTMTHLKFWVNSPVALAKTALPKLYFESASGTPNHSGKIDMASYLTTDLVANTWTEITIPLADFWAADATFTAKDFVHGLFFSQNATDNVEHLMYMDEFTFVNISTLFHDSGDSRFYDTSYIGQTLPSVVVAENWQGPNMTGGDKFPVVATPVKSGANALKLDWKSVTGGDWNGMVAAIAWPVFDLTKRTHLDFWVNSPVALAKAALPKIYLESASGTPNHTGKVNMSSYLTTDLVANTWTEVTIPVADLWAADATFTAKDLVHGVFFSQNTADNVEHLMYLDEFNFITVATTGIFTPTVQKTVLAYYSNGQILVPDYVGNIRVFDLAGKTVADGFAADGKLRLSVNKGIYIVKTSNGVAKISVQ